VNRIENRIAEAERLGFKTMFISSYNFSKIKPDKYKLEIIGVKKLDDLIVKLFLKKKS